MDIAKRIEKIIGPAVDDLGFEIVRITVIGSEHVRLQIMAEPKDGRPMDVEDCAAVSRAIAAVMDVEDPIKQAYALEVSSPGIDRPLTRPKDFRDWAGFDAKVEMTHAIEGGRRHTGRLIGLDEEDTVLIEVEGKEHRLPLADVQRAKLLLTDELIAAVAQEQET